MFSTISLSLEAAAVLVMVTHFRVVAVLAGIVLRGTLRHLAVEAQVKLV
tara:strand:- start:362 stop:508 length:147 start_codon:yes stop_codon:yes gene_type:complete